MSKVTYYVGLDYHQHSIQVCVMDQQGNIIQNATRPNDIRTVSKVVPEGGTVFAAIEACWEWRDRFGVAGGDRGS